MKKYINNLVISLTSYPNRINSLHFTLQTLFSQSIKPEKIILVLASCQFMNKENDLPENIKLFINKGLEILWCENDLKSYKKIIPTLTKYPNKIIVTADDDILYDKDWLKILYKAYLKDKKTIHCHRCHIIKFDNNKILPYNNWEYECKYEYKSYLCFQTGVGGVLYPPCSLYQDVTNQKLFMQLSPLADDIWLWAMAVLNHTKIHNIGIKNKAKITLNYSPNTQECFCLSKVNTLNQNLNNKQISNILSKYDKLKKIIMSQNYKLITIRGKYYKYNYFLYIIKNTINYLKKLKRIIFN